MSSSLLFVSTNRHKFDEAASALARHDIKLSMLRKSLEEIQSRSIREISRRKARAAFDACSRPVLVEDACLEIDSLNGFPGPYSSFVFETLGNGTVIKMLGRDRRASFTSVVSYCDGASLRSFAGTIPGHISRTISGNGWGYDPIFVPRGSKLSFAQQKATSHRTMALEGFARWYARRGARS